MKVRVEQPLHRVVNLVPSNRRSPTELGQANVERFLFEGNMTGMRAGIPLSLRNGVFRGNEIGLDLGGVEPDAAQLLGVSFVGNAVDLD